MAPAAACRTPAAPAARRRQRRARLSMRPTSSAFSRSRSADFERRFPAGLDVHLRPQALQAVEAVLGQPGLELALGLHLFLQRAQRVQRARRGRPACALCALTSSCCARRCSSSAAPAPAARAGALRRRDSAASSAGTWRLQACRAAAASGALRPCRSAASRSRRAFSARDLLLACCGCRRPAPGSAAAPALTACALLVGCAPRAARTASSSAGSVSRCALGLRGQLGRLAPRPRRSARRAARPRRRRPRGAAPTALFCASSSAMRCSTRCAAFDDVADALFEPAHLERGLGQRALRGVQRVAGGVVRLAHGLELGLDLAQLGHARFERVVRLVAPPA